MLEWILAYGTLLLGTLTAVGALYKESKLITTEAEQKRIENKPKKTDKRWNRIALNTK